MPDASGRFRGISVPRLPWLEPAPDVCPTCERYRRQPSGAGGARIHACERVPRDWIVFDCPCGCDIKENG